LQVKNLKGRYSALEVKDILYQAISGYQEQKILSDIVHGESPTTISTIYFHCIPELDRFTGDKLEIHISFAEGLIHYMLTTALIPSQRKTMLQSVDIDIVVPDAKTLVSSPQDAIIISFPKMGELETIKEHVKKLKKIQSNSENIWIVLDRQAPIDVKVYTLDKDHFTFSNIINDLISFSSNKTQSKLKIFKI